ncbi:hypothetical protein BDV11DRAFT_171504 [Aspergillus similis]
MGPSWTRLTRFIAEEDGQAHIGEVDARQFPDVGLAVVNGERIAVRLIQGSIFDGAVTEKQMHVARVGAPIPTNLLAPIDMEDVPIIRCMGLNYRDHAREANMAIPDVPVLFIKPRTALNGSHPAKINVPKIAQDGSSDHEAELSIILSKTGRDIPESAAMNYVLGYTCSNDVSARMQQFKNSQWCFSKGETRWLVSAGSRVGGRLGNRSASAENKFQRFRKGPAPVHKLGHFGMCVTNFAKTFEFYTTRFNFNPSDLVYDESGRDITTFLHLDRGMEKVDHHCFFFFEGPKSHVHHSSYETHNFDTQVMGHDWLRHKGYENCWGVGRHVMGSQIFDYCFDTSGLSSSTM